MRERVEQVCAEFGVDGNPYLVSIQEGSLEREDFIATQCQFLFAVRYFSRPMSALLSRIPTNRQRVEILKALYFHNQVYSDFQIFDLCRAKKGCQHCGIYMPSLSWA